MEENHIVHENPRALFPDGSSQTCECATKAVRVDGGTSWHEIQQEWSSAIPEDRDLDDVVLLHDNARPCITDTHIAAAAEQEFINFNCVTIILLSKQLFKRD
jgi:2-C-methyl-D-erythritol 4-phosphate cytidylyltransferase